MDASFHAFQKDVEDWHWWYSVRRDILDEKLRPLPLSPSRGRARPQILDLGCGTGGFLIQWAHLTGGWGAGVDMSDGALAAARVNAADFGVADKLSFYLGEVGKDRLPIGDDAASKIDALTAMFMLHEFGRHGDAAIVQVLSSLRAQFPGKLLLALEMQPVDVYALGGRPPPAMDALDYHFIHPLSRQGEPRPKDAWQAIYEEAGMKLLAVRRPKNSPLLIHVVRMGHPS